VETASQGVDYRPEPAMGVRAAATGVVALRDVSVAQDALLCTGADYAEAITRSRLGWCALAAGCSLAVLDHVIPYVNERKAFGEPISHRQAVAFTVADMAIEVEGMRLTTYRAASLLDQDQDATHATAIARRLCADKGMGVGSHGVQLLGGHGYVKEYPVERWYRDLRATAVMEGAVMV
jgi:alkylation response protein AidB-like acyl-CoA dehydrogenase